MKKIVAMAALGLMAVGFASSASAYTFSPVSTSFSGSGPATATLFGINLACTAKLKGSTNATGGGTITSGSFTGAFGCSVAHLTGLPWTMTPTSLTTATLPNVSISSPLGSCGPATLTFHLVSGVFSYSGNLGECTNVTLTLTTTPAVNIVN